MFVLFVLVLLPLPWLAWWLLPAARSGNAAAIRLPFHRRFETLSAGTGGQIRRSGSIVVLKSLAWCLLVLAAAQPVWLGAAQPVSTQGRDLMLALDLSGSMETPDFEVQGRAVDRRQKVVMGRRLEAAAAAAVLAATAAAVAVAATRLRYPATYFIVWGQGS